MSCLQNGLAAVFKNTALNERRILMRKTVSAVLLTAVLALCLSVLASAGALSLADVTAGKTDSPPVIDGVFDPQEGWGDPIVHHDTSDLKEYAETDPGFENLIDDPALMISNLDVYMKWDDTAFYYCATVTDPEHFNPEMDAAIWRGDSIIFHVVSVPNDDSRARILFGMDNDGDTWAYQETMEDGTPETSTTDKWKITRNEDSKVTAYEAYFLWEDIIPAGKLSAGETFYLRDLFLLANKDHAEPVVAVVPEGYTNGTRNYYRITLGEGSAAAVLEGQSAFEDVMVTEDQEFYDDPDTLYEGGSGQPIQFVAGYGVGYSSLNDQVIFHDINFGSKGADKMLINFSNGGADDTTLAIYIDEKAGDPDATFTIPNTGGWEATWAEDFIADINVKPGLHDVIIEFTNSNSGSFYYIRFHEIGAPDFDVKPAEPETPAETGGTKLLSKSWDNIYIDYEQMVNGSANVWLADNPIEGSYIETLEARGWAYISTPITAFAYTVDGSDPVKSEDFIVDRPDVKSAISEEAEGFDIEIDVSALSAGDHLIKIFAVSTADELIDTTFDLPFSQEEKPAEEPKTEEPKAEEPKTEEPAAEPEPEPAVEEPKAEQPAEAPAGTPKADEKKSGCGSFLGGGLIVMTAVLGAAWIAKRK